MPTQVMLRTGVGTITNSPTKPAATMAWPSKLAPTIYSLPRMLGILPITSLNTRCRSKKVERPQMDSSSLAVWRPNVPEGVQVPVIAESGPYFQEASVETPSIEVQGVG